MKNFPGLVLSYSPENFQNGAKDEVGVTKKKKKEEM